MVEIEIIRIFQKMLDKCISANFFNFFFLCTKTGRAINRVINNYLIYLILDYSYESSSNHNHEFTIKFTNAQTL